MKDKLTYMETLKERMEEFERLTGWDVAKIHTTAGVSSSAVSQWFGRGSKVIHSIQIEPAILLGMATGFNPLWLSKGRLPKMLPGGRSTPWPFEGISPERWAALSERQKGRVEKVASDEIHAIESELKNGTTGHS